MGKSRDAGMAPDLAEQREVKHAGCTKVQVIGSTIIQEEGVRKGLKTDGIFEGQYKVQLDPRLPYTPVHPGQKWDSESEKL